jgi:hypothetical protein
VNLLFLTACFWLFAALHRAGRFCCRAVLRSGLGSIGSRLRTATTLDTKACARDAGKLPFVNGGAWPGP